jgi:RimJ/RimL family protein N-acetyltransferase
MCAPADDRCRILFDRALLPRGAAESVMTIEPPTLTGDRVRLDPLRVEDADAMAVSLADGSLDAVTGGEPPDSETLRRRYAAQTVGQSPDGHERWLNWIVRRRDEGDAVGYVQATIGVVADQAAADIAWVVGLHWQRRGIATEAARLMVHWLVAMDRAGGPITTVTAHIGPGHEASAAVARRLGLRPTERIEDGEVVWEADAARIRLVGLARWAPELEALRDRAGTWQGGERDEHGTIQVPYVVLSDRILAFVRDMAGLGWVHPFDWPAWAASPDGRRLIEAPDRIASATADDLGRLLTTIVRGDRFSEGQLLHAAEAGLLLAIARRAAALLDERDGLG